MSRPLQTYCLFSAIITAAFVGPAGAEPTSAEAPEASTPAPAAKPASGLVLLFSKTETDEGRLRCMAWKGPEGYPMDGRKAVAAATCKPKDKRAKCVFKDLPQGVYAVGCYHDENDNGWLDTNFLGIPKEGVAASNNSTRTFGPPRFDDAKVRFEGSLTQTLEIDY